MAAVRRAPERRGWKSAFMLLGPSAIMWVYTQRQQRACFACFVFHAFMAAVLIYHRGRALPAATRESAAQPPRGPSNGASPARVPDEVQRQAGVSRAAFFAILAFGLSVYVVCRSTSAPGEYLGVDLAVLRATLDGFGASSVSNVMTAVTTTG